MSTALDLDLATLVGELEDVPCESAGHGMAYMHDGPATHYAEWSCQGCGQHFLKAYCGPFVKFIQTPNHEIWCPRCFHTHDAPKTVTILGPVNGRAS